MNNNKIKFLLNSLIKSPFPLANMKKEIQKHSGEMIDIGDTVILHREDIKRFMNMFLNGEINADQLCCWAELVEGRDGIAYEDGFWGKIADVLFWLSEPEINGLITKEKAINYIKHLS